MGKQQRELEARLLAARDADGLAAAAAVAAAADEARSRLAMLAASLTDLIKTKADAAAHAETRAKVDELLLAQAKPEDENALLEALQKAFDEKLKLKVDRREIKAMLKRLVENGGPSGLWGTDDATRPRSPTAGGNLSTAALTTHEIRPIDDRDHCLSCGALKAAFEPGTTL